MCCSPLPISDAFNCTFTPNPSTTAADGPQHRTLPRNQECSTGTYGLDLHCMCAMALLQGTTPEGVKIEIESIPLAPTTSQGKTTLGRLKLGWPPRPGTTGLARTEGPTVLNAGSGNRIRSLALAGEEFSGHTEESGNTGSLGVLGRRASDSSAAEYFPVVRVLMACLFGIAYPLPSVNGPPIASAI